jgi:hypothetical protein
MNRVTIAAVAFLLFAIGVSIWLLSRPSGTAGTQGEIPVMDPHSGLTFAEWAVKSDGVLLADIDPGAGVSTIPRRFVVIQVKRDPDGSIHTTDGPTFSWATADRGASASSLFVLGYRVSTEDRAFNPPDDPLWSDPIPKVEGATEQTVTLRAKTSGVTTSFHRRKDDPHSVPYWNRRAIGFLSGDGHMVYVTPDAIVIPTGSAAGASSAH